MPIPMTLAFEEVVQRHKEITEALKATSRFLLILLVRMEVPYRVLHVKSSLFPKPFEHHAIVDLRSGHVFHFALDQEDETKCMVKLEQLSKYMEDYHGWQLVAVANRQEAQEVIEKARSAVGNSDYNLVFNNCEHFATWCMEGTMRSGQVDTTMTIGASATGSAPLVALTARGATATPTGTATAIAAGGAEVRAVAAASTCSIVPSF